LPGYRLRPTGPPALDRFIDAAALDDLPTATGRYRARANDGPGEAASANGTKATPREEHRMVRNRPVFVPRAGAAG
jgi:hypothetical protein